MEELGTALAVAVKTARTERGLTAEALASMSGVSRAMISKIERCEAQPSAVLLAKLAVAFGMTLSELIARAEGGQERLRRSSEQPSWTDPETGYTRKAISPPSSPALELVEVTLPAGAEVSYPAGSYRFTEQQIWVLDGQLRFIEGAKIHELDTGDCLQLGPATDCTFSNPTKKPCRYLIALDKSAAARLHQPYLTTKD